MNKRRKKGVALIITVGILALLAMIATSFAYNMMFDLKGAANYVLKMKAKNAAEAGINLSIAYLRQLATSDFNAVPTSACDWAYTNATQPSFDGRDGTTGNSTSALLGDVGRGHIAVCSLRVTDTNSQININDTNPNLNVILGNLGTILAIPGWAQANADSIVSGRPAGGYSTKEGIVEYMPGADLTAKRVNYALIRDFVTVNSYIDQYSEDATAPLPTSNNYQSKSPVNLNTARREVLRAVLRPLVSSDANASQVAGAIITARAMVSPFRSWNGSAAAGGFNAFIDNINPTILTNPQKDAIKNNFNPNKVKQGAYTTDFCFHPGGFYEIISTGTVGIDNNSDGAVEDVKARQELTAVARIYSILNYTAKEQFRGEDANYNGILDAGEDANGNGVLDEPIFFRITWLNTCPVLSTDDLGLRYANNYTTIAGSLKLGFWDNFDEDNYDTNMDGKADTGYSMDNWQAVNRVMVIEDKDTDGDWELGDDGTVPAYAKFALTDMARWQFNNKFSLRVNVRSRTVGDGKEDTGHVEFWDKDGSHDLNNMYVQNWGFDYDHPKDKTITGTSVNLDPFNGAWPVGDGPVQGKDFCDTKMVLAMYHSNDTRTYGIHRFFRDPLTGVMLADQVPNHFADFYNIPTSTFNEEGKDDFHGVYPTYHTMKVVVSNTSYRVYLAMSDGWNQRWRYHPYGNFNISKACDVVDYLYHYIPFDPVGGQNETFYDRYNRAATITSGRGWLLLNWELNLYGNNALPYWEEVRVIPSDGFYQSPSFNAALLNDNHPVVWGTASWTLTIPGTANAATETTSLDIIDAGTGTVYSDITRDGPINQIFQSMSFKTNLLTTDVDYDQTPVLEDITITYLPRVNIVYLKQ